MTVFDVFKDPAFSMEMTPSENVIMRIREHMFFIPSSDVAHIKFESDVVEKAEPVEMPDAEPKPLVMAKRRGRPPFKHPEVSDSGA
jgi:hypothetical protein